MMATTNVSIVSPEAAFEIASWRYEAPYDVYDIDQTPAAIAELSGGTYYAVSDRDGATTGFYCFGEAARVPCVDSASFYQESGYLDIGLGLRPDLTGAGAGRSFVAAGLVFGKQTFAPEKGFRLTVAQFNARAIAVYTRLGFRQLGVFLFKQEGGGIPFSVYTLAIGQF